jgi:hypothetical protein
MTFYIRTLRGRTDNVAYETLDHATEQVSQVMQRERGIGHKPVNEGGRVSFYEQDGGLIDSLRIEDEAGSEVPIPAVMIDIPVEELADDVRVFDRFGTVYEGPLDREELYDRHADPNVRRS